MLRTLAHRTKHSPATRLMSTSAPPPLSTLPRPTSLPAALVQIDQLESRLAAVSRAVLRTSGLSLDDLLLKAGEAETAIEVKAAFGNSEQKAPDEFAREQAGSGGEGEEGEGKAEPLDISPLILRALAIRKKVAAGSLGAEEAEAGVKALLVEGMTAEQERTIREWAGTK